MKYAVLTPDQFDDHEVIALIEGVPAFNRDPHFQEELRKISSPEISSSPESKKEDREDTKDAGTIYFG